MLGMSGLNSTRAIASPASITRPRWITSRTATRSTSGGPSGAVSTGTAAARRRFAYTYPEVRAYVISLLREVVQYPVDGICMLYNRRLPLVEYEPQLVEVFRADHGVDPRSLDPLDPTWLSYRSGVLTQFHRELRAAMDEETRATGPQPSPSDISGGRWHRGRKSAFRSRSRSLGERRPGRHADSVFVGQGFQ